MPTADPTLSIVVPCFHEEAGLPMLHDRLTRVCRHLGVRYEIVLVDDGSRDGSWSVMSRLAQGDPHLVCLHLSRNHGQQLALTAGLAESRGDFVLVIDADLQDPPELLPEMVALLHAEQADVVYGRRKSRDGETRFKLLTSRLFYRSLNCVATVPMPADTGDFRLMTRRVVNRFLEMPERNRFARGLFSWVGFKQVPMLYERQARVTGTTNYTFRSLCLLAWDALASFSTVPLKLAMFGGVISGIVALVVGLLAMGDWLREGEVPAQGFTVCLLALLTAGHLVGIGMIGEYLARMVGEVQRRPHFTIAEVIRPRVERAERIPWNRAA